MPPDIHAGTQTPGDLTDAAIRAQLATILTSEVFARSRHLRRFLSFVVEQTLAGQSQSLKESVLATELYGKGTDFDGGTDPVVRVDARRLRDKLREYYAGRSDAVVISLPKGSYVPVFEAGPAAPAPAAPAVVVEEPPAPLRAPNFRRATTGIVALAVVAAAIAGVLVWRARPAPLADPQLLPLASYPGMEGPPALSPDGNLVAFAWSGHADGGPTDIYVKAVGSEALRQLTATPASETSPAWSPDGLSVAFVREGQGVFTMSQLGGAERRVSASGTHVAWGGDSASVLIRDREDGSRPFGIYRISLDTLQRVRLTQAPVGDGDWRFEVSPDGKSLAFIRYEKRGIADLYVATVGGGEPRRLSNWNGELTGLSWTPDSREIVYSVEEPAAGRLWRIQAEGSGPARGSPIPDIAATAVNPSISRPSPGQPARLAFQTITQDVDVHLVDLHSRLPDETFDSTPFSSSTRIEGAARFSPDGSRIAFTSARSGGFDLWVARRDGSDLLQVTRLGAPGFLGEWSPDGTRIAFEASVAGNTDVYLVGADGGPLSRLTDESSIDGVPSWSGDGQWIYFASTRAGAIPDIWRVSRDGGEAVRITHGGRFQPQESPDGQYLYYVDRHPAGLASDETARLIRLSLVSGREEVIVDRVRPFLWSVTDAAILFVTRERDFDAIDAYRFSDRRIVRVGRLKFRIPGIYPYMTVSGDGRWALATKLVRFDSDLMRLDNFR